MNVLITGASGFIGQALTRALRARGHAVVEAGRSSAVQADFSQVPARDWWLPRLAGVDVVINAVGILREDAGRSFRALHAEAPTQLFQACAEAGVKQVIQVSALGADDAATSRYHLTKKAADDALRALAVPSVIVQPSVVYGPGGSSAALFNKMAVSPLLPLPMRGRMQVQPVHVDDVAEAIVALVEAGPVPGSRTIAFTGPEPLTLADYLASLRRQLGVSGRLRTVAVPVPLFRLGAAMAGHLPGSMLDAETADMLLRGNAATDPAFAALLGRAPRAAGAFVPRETAPLLRTQAVVDLWEPVLRASVALVWIWTGLVSLGLYPVQDSLALLARVGLHGGLATVALYGAAVLDLALGVLTWVSPARWRSRVWASQLALIAGYTALITLFLPEYWLHPYGPLSKNLPMLAAIALLWALDRKG